MKKKHCAMKKTGRDFVADCGSGTEGGGSIVRVSGICFGAAAVVVNSLGEWRAVWATLPYRIFADFHDVKDK